MGKVKLFTSPAILLEFRKVVANKFKLSEQRINELVDTITSFATIVKLKKKISVNRQKDDDNRILECTGEEGLCSYTGTVLVPVLTLRRTATKAVPTSYQETSTLPLIPSHQGRGKSSRMLSEASESL